jgi:hypothetical protein
MIGAATQRFWVVDTGNDRVQRFSSAANLELQFGEEGSGDGQFDEPTGIATGTFTYVVDTGNDRVEKFVSAGEYKGKFGQTGSGDGQFKEPTGIAVDSKGFVWVVDSGNNRIEKFNSSGEYKSKCGETGSGNGQFKEPTGIAIDYKDNIWVVDSGNNRIEKFNAECAYQEQFGEQGSGEGQLESPTWIANPSPWHFLVTDTGNDRVTSWSVKPNPPLCTTNSATSVGSEGATLNATINPEGATTEYHFEYGTTTSYGTSVPVPDEAIGSGTESVKASQVAKGLKSKTTYHFRSVCKNAGGTVNGKDVTFTTT